MALSTGADVLAWLDFGPLHGRRVGLVANQTSTTSDGRHLFDLLATDPNVDLRTVFAPEHGVRGRAAPGAEIGDFIDTFTGVPVRSLYDTTRAPTGSELAELDVLVYDLQDAGTRFYTFISTMGLAMAAAADAGIEFVVLDRPNPLGDGVAGFTRTPDQVSFVSSYPIPTTYGMTAGELARMIADQGLVDGRVLPEPTVIELVGWNRAEPWSALDRPWVAPSPGLPTEDAILTYPATVWFEATTLSFGKGTVRPFNVIGAPWINGPQLAGDLNDLGLAGVRFEAATFTPDPAIDPDPRWANQGLSGIEVVVTDPTTTPPTELGVHLLVALREHAAGQGVGQIIDRPAFFDLLAGTSQLRQMLNDGSTAVEIIEAWQRDVAAFEAARAPYLLYDAD